MHVLGADGATGFQMLTPLPPECELPLVMGIINATPDSFYDGGRWAQRDAAVRHGLDLALEGAQILDVGGESTRPGAAPVPTDEQIRRVAPVLEALAAQTDCLLSVDTSDAAVAEQALAAGAHWINDVSGLRHDPRLVEVAASSEAPVVCMHRLGTPRSMQANPQYDDVVDDIRAFFEQRLAWLAERGVARERVILDPGIGFGKTVAHNLEILRRVDTFAELGRPLCVGHSRKSFIGRVLGLGSADDRLAGTLAVTASLWRRGVQILRVHDVQAAVQTIQMLRAIELAPADGI
jgi:dihydropteroate synthase